jgi:hypothetical protein
MVKLKVKGTFLAWVSKIIKMKELLDNQGSSILFMELEEAFKALDQKLEAFLNLKLVQIILTCGLTGRI